jgi:hypothetical protein
MATVICDNGVYYDAPAVHDLERAAFWKNFRLFRSKWREVPKPERLRVAWCLRHGLILAPALLLITDPDFKSFVESR